MSKTWPALRAKSESRGKLQDPYRHVRRVFWIVDNGSESRWRRSIRRLRRIHPNLLLVHGPVYTSWLNQIEIYFSVLQRNIGSRPCSMFPSDPASRRCPRASLGLRLHQVVSGTLTLKLPNLLGTPRKAGAVAGLLGRSRSRRNLTYRSKLSAMK